MFGLHNPFLRFLLLLCAFTAFASPRAAAAIYYVAPNGSDSSPGSAAAPFATLQKGANAARAGDTVVVRDGTYGHVNAVTGGDNANYAASPVNLYYSGTPSAWITFKAENKWGVVLDCEMICDSYIDLRNASYVSIEGFVIARGYKEGIHSNDAAHHIALRRNRIEYIANRYTTTQIGQDGMYTNPNCHDFIIDGNVFHDIGRTNALHFDHALYIRGWNFTITNNVFYNNTRGWAIQLAEGASNVLIANNTFAFPNPNKDGHIMMWNTQSGLTIRNNIFYSPRNYAIDRYASSVSSCSVDRNIVYGASGVIANSSGCAVGNNQVGANPMFVNPSAYDFHIQASGAGVDAGMNLGEVPLDFDGVNRPKGVSTDVGAFEYDAPAGPVISSVFVSSLQYNSAVINWSTDKPSTSYVEFGVGGYSTTTTEDTVLTTVHSVVLTNLSPSTQYQFRAASRDSGGRLGVSSNASFTTPAPPVPQFSLSASPSTLTIVNGQSGSSTITATVTSGNPGTIAFVASSVPAGVTASFSPPSCWAGCSTTFTLAVSTGAPSGTYQIPIGGTGTDSSAATNVMLTIQQPAPPPPVADTQSGLVALWDFAERWGTRAADSSGNGNTATMRNTSWSSSVCSGCVRLNGYSSFGSVVDSASLQLTSRMTVAMWLNAGASGGADPRLVSKRYDWDVKLNGSGRYPQFSAGGRYAMLNRSLPAGSWQHAVFTFSSGTVKGYVNGQLVPFSQNTFSGSQTLPTYQYGLFLGTLGDNSGYFGGYLDDIRIYNRALSDADVAALYAQTRH